MCNSFLFSFRLEWQVTLVMMGSRFLFLKPFISLIDWVVHSMIFSSMSLSQEDMIIRHMDFETASVYIMWPKTAGILRNSIFLNMPIRFFNNCRTVAANMPIAIDRGQMITVGNRSVSYFLDFIFLNVCIDSWRLQFETGSSSWADGPITQAPPELAFTSTSPRRTHGGRW